MRFPTYSLPFSPPMLMPTDWPIPHTRARMLCRHLRQRMWVRDAAACEQRSRRTVARDGQCHEAESAESPAGAGAGPSSKDVGHTHGPQGRSP